MFNRNAISRGHAIFYTVVYPEMRKIAADRGWALGLHGSLTSDMDLMAMPWTENAVPADELMAALNRLFMDNGSPWKVKKDSTSKPNGRVVYTIPIYSDYYCDINIIECGRKPIEYRAKKHSKGHYSYRGFSVDCVGYDKTLKRICWEAKDSFGSVVAHLYTFKEIKDYVDEILRCEIVVDKNDDTPKLFDIDKEYNDDERGIGSGVPESEVGETCER